jgi:hypothetical protein
VKWTLELENPHDDLVRVFYWRESMRIELTFPDQSRETADLKSGTGTSSVTSPFLKRTLLRRETGYLISTIDYTEDVDESQL